MEVDTNKLFSIPLLSNLQTTDNISSCGIHDIGISPAYHYVATSGRNPNDLALYKYPTFDPLLIGKVSPACMKVLFSSFIEMTKWNNMFHHVGT